MARKRKQESEKKVTHEANAVPTIPSVRESDEPPPKKLKWVNKQRVMVLGSRGLVFRHRHLMNDIRSFLPHCKQEGKKESKDDLSILNEIAEIRNCNKCIYFECRKKKDLYMWLSNTPCGPSVKFHITNMHTMGELKFSGNCLQGTRAILSFDNSFSDSPHWSLMREILTHIFNTPNQHPKSQPFVDHVFTFAIVDNKIWFRNFQILEEEGQLTEIGPRFVLDPIKVFDGSFGGATLWSNPHFLTPNAIRSQHKMIKTNKYIEKTEQRKDKKQKAFKPGGETFKGDPMADVFKTHMPKKKNKQIENIEEEEEEEEIEDEEIEREIEKDLKSGVGATNVKANKQTTKKSKRKHFRQKEIFGRNIVK